MSSPSMREPNDLPPAMRASDADREHVVSLLGQALAEGRLSPEEHSERVESAYGARTMVELRPLVADLPVEFAPPTGRAAQRGAAGQAAPVDPGLAVVAVFGEAKRTGRWLVRDGMSARALFGSVELDLTEAVLEKREVVITANALFGEVILRVPDGVVVHDEGSAIFGSRRAGVGAADVTADTPVVRVRGAAVFGSVEAKRPKKKWLKLS